MGQGGEPPLESLAELRPAPRPRREAAGAEIQLLPRLRERGALQARQGFAAPSPRPIPPYRSGMRPPGRPLTDLPGRLSNSGRSR